MVASVRSWRGEKQRTRQSAGLGFGAEEAGFRDVKLGGGDVGLEGGEVVFEDEGAGVVRRDVAAGAGVAGAEVAGGVVAEARRAWRGFRSGPARGAGCDVRRDDAPTRA